MSETSEIKRVAGFSLFELWKLRKLHIGTGTQYSNMETVSVWSVINGEPDGQEARELIAELKKHLAGGSVSVKVRRLWAVELDRHLYPLYAESEEEAEYAAREMARFGAVPGTLVAAPQGFEDNPGVVSVISYVAQRVIPFK